MYMYMYTIRTSRNDRSVLILEVSNVTCYIGTLRIVPFIVVLVSFQCVLITEVPLDMYKCFVLQGDQWLRTSRAWSCNRSVTFILVVMAIRVVAVM